jgi:hypothetical protein
MFGVYDSDSQPGVSVPPRGTNYEHLGVREKMQ